MRITQKVLDAMVEDLNKEVNLPGAWTKTDDGGIKANPGSFTLGAVYGGYRLEMITTYGGGTCDVSGFLTARELYNYIKGMHLGHDIAAQIKGVKEAAVSEEEHVQAAKTNAYRR